MAVVFSNNATTVLSSNITNSATSIAVQDGSVFPTLSGTDYFYATLQDPGNTKREIVKVTARSGNTLTVTRAVDGSSASAFSANDAFELRLNAAALNDAVNSGTADLELNSFTGDGSEVDFTLSMEALEANTLVYIDGVYQNKTAYSISGYVLTFSAAPDNGAAIEVTTATVAPIQESTDFLLNQFTGDGSDTTFTLSSSPEENQTTVFISGVYQSKSNYSISGTTLTFSTAPPASSSIEVMVARTVVYGIGTPSNDTVSTAKIVDGAVTPAKLSLTYATETYVGTAVSNLVDSSPAALDTLNELAAALGDDPNFATTVTNSIALKAPLASPSFTGTATMDGLTVNATGSAIELSQSAAGSATYYTMDNTVETGGKRWRFGYSGGSSDKGSFSFYNQTDNNLALLLTSSGATFSGNVGIANSSLSNWASGYNALQVGGRAFFAAHSSSDSYFGQNAYINSGWKYASTAAASFIQQSGGKIQFYVAPSGTADSAISWTNAVEIDNSGNLALMTDGAELKLYYTEPRKFISNNGAQAIIKMIDNDVSTAMIDFQSWTNSSLMRLMNTGNLLVGRSSDSGLGKLQVYGGADIAGGDVYLARDTGNVLVGKAASDGGIAGHELRSGSFAIHTRDNGPSLYARRIGAGANDSGDVQVFENADGKVASMGFDGVNLYVNFSETNNVGIASGTSGGAPVLFPTGRDGAVRDDAVSLGYGTGRFKDLYLSGGVYLGGTGAANKLDSYEEGTWSPNIKAVGGTTSAAFSSVSSTYTKVGRLVTVNTYIYNINYSGITDGTYIVISNLPFAAGDNYGGSCLAYTNGDVNSVYLNRFTDYAYLCNDTNGNEFLQNGTAPTTTKFMATIIYQTA